MKEETIKGNWYYKVYVSKDSPHNVKRGFDLPDSEYHRGYYAPCTYTILKEASTALEYYQKGHVEKYRNLRKGGRSWRESKIVHTL